MKEEMAICPFCESPIPLVDIRANRCASCLNDIMVWNIDFMGDIHEKVDRKVTSWTD